MDANSSQKSPRLLRLAQTIQRVGYRKSKIHKLIAAGEFPLPVKDGRSTFFVESEIDDYVHALIKRARAAPAPKWKKIPRKKEDATNQTVRRNGSVSVAPEGDARVNERKTTEANNVQRRPSAVEARPPAGTKTLGLRGRYE